MFWTKVFMVASQGKNRHNWFQVFIANDAEAAIEMARATHADPDSYEYKIVKEADIKGGLVFEMDADCFNCGAFLFEDECSPNGTPL